MHFTVRRWYRFHVQSHRVGSDLSVHKAFDEVDIANSTAFSPDDKLIYFADTVPCRAISE